MASSTAELMQALPWGALLIVFLVMAVLLRIALSTLADALRALVEALGRQPSQPPGGAPAVPSLPKQPPALPAEPALKPPVPAEPARPAPPASGVPPWWLLATHEIGFHEIGDNQGIERYISLAHTGALGDPWCAIFANAMLESSGVPGSRSPSSQSFRTHPAFVQLQAPALGCLCVFWRGSKNSGLGHVGFYGGENATHVWVVGGNEQNMVQDEALPKDSPTFGLIGYWWPRSVALPTGGPILLPAGTPTSIKTPGGVPDVPAVPPAHPLVTGATVTGKMSTFGGPADTGMSPSEGLALVEPVEIAKFPGIFLSEQPPGTTGFGRRLDPKAHYIAMRWDYKVTLRSWLQANKVQVTANGKTFEAQPVDWGPNLHTGRIADLSPGLAEALGLQTDDTVTITIPQPAATAAA
jgi:uncharacterized protein (TIGR02594 family)